MTESGTAPTSGTAPQQAGSPSAAALYAKQPMWPRVPSALGRAMAEFWKPLPPMGLRTVSVCVGVGLAAAWLLVGNRPGIGVAVVGLLVWAAAVPVLVRRRAFGDLCTVGLCVALTSVVAVRDAGWVLAFCLVAAAGAGAAAVTAARTAPAVLASPMTWAAGVIRAVPWAGRGLRSAALGRRERYLVGLRSLAVTVGLLLVFGLLFASADTVFASYLTRFDPGLLPAQLVVGLLVALATATTAQLALAPPAWSVLTVPPGRQARSADWLLPVLALGALVLAFVLVQVGALLGGHAHVLETAGLTYAQYARRGFAQLVVATVLTLVVVGVAARHAPRRTRREQAMSRAALGLLCLGALGVVASALRRIDLYVEAFGLTRTRLLVVVTEIALGVVLVLVLAAGVRWRGGWLPRAVVQVATVAVLGLAAVNPDAQILRHNTTADLDVPVDVLYLRSLSGDAVPAMDRLAEPLRSCLLAGRRPTAADGVSGWNLGRARADAALEGAALKGAALEGAALDGAARMPSVDGSACAQFLGGRALPPALAR